VQEGAHAFVTTPGAARFYRSAGEPAVQQAALRVEAGARLEWLPAESIAYDACLAENHLVADLADGAEMFGWDVTALGLPAAGKPFDRGSFLQHVELKGHWIERGRIDAADSRLMDGPLGLAGRRCMATLFFACGTPVADARREHAIEVARETMQAHGEGCEWGVTAPGPRVVAARVLSEVVEPAMLLLRRVHAAWRPAMWDLPAVASRLWAL
jgi:urease accessory protein